MESCIADRAIKQFEDGMSGVDCAKQCWRATRSGCAPSNRMMDCSLAEAQTIRYDAGMSTANAFKSSQRRVRCMSCSSFVGSCTVEPMAIIKSIDGHFQVECFEMSLFVVEFMGSMSGAMFSGALNVSV